MFRFLKVLNMCNNKKRQSKHKAQTKISRYSTRQDPLAHPQSDNTVIDKIHLYNLKAIEDVQ